jgi:hypothetical protein
MMEIHSMQLKLFLLTSRGYRQAGVSDRRTCARISWLAGVRVVCSGQLATQCAAFLRQENWTELAKIIETVGNGLLYDNIGCQSRAFNGNVTQKTIIIPLFPRKKGKSAHLATGRLPNNSRNEVTVNKITRILPGFPVHQPVITWKPAWF